MFCPKCRAEFREGFTECKKCGVDLVEELSEEEIVENKDVDKYLAFLNWKIEKWLKVGGMTLIIVSLIVETLLALQRFIPGIYKIEGKALFYALLQLVYSLIKNVMYGVFYIALGNLLEIMKGKRNELE